MHTPLVVADDSVTLRIRGTWRSRLKLVLLVLRIHIGHWIMVVAGALVVASVAGAVLGPSRIDPLRLDAVAVLLLPSALVVIAILFVAGVRPTFHWLRNVTELKLTSERIRVTLKNGRTLEPGWSWIDVARRRPFGLEIVVREPTWARWYVRRADCGEEVFARLERLLVARGKLPRPA